MERADHLDALPEGEAMTDTADKLAEALREASWHLPDGTKADRMAEEALATYEREKVGQERVLEFVATQEPLTDEMQRALNANLFNSL